MAASRMYCEGGTAEGGAILSADLPPKVLLRVSMALGKSWKNLGRIMDIPDATLESIEFERANSSLQDMAYKMLIKWKEKMGRMATLTILKKNLEDIERKDIASNLETDSNSPFNSPTTFDKNISVDLMKDIENRLTDDYLHLQMKGLPWMNEIVLTLDKYYVDLSMTTLDQKGKESSPKSVQVKEIFTQLEGRKKSTRILIEGGPGMGKSTLVAKLAYDWAKRVEYVKNFDLVFLLPLRYVEGTIEEILCKAATVNVASQNCLSEILLDKSRRIMLLLDGYDEISSEIRSVVLPLFRNHVYSHLTIVVTSRPGYFTSNTTNDNASKLLWKGDIVTPFSSNVQTRIMVKGFKRAQQLAFVETHLENVCSEEEKDAIRLKIGKMVDKEFLKCPLFLLMLIIMFTDEGESGSPPETKTDLFKNVFNFVIRRYFNKKGQDSVPEIDLFSFQPNELPSHIRLMLQFSELAAWAVNNDSMAIDLKEITKELNLDSRVVELGFLTQCITFKGFREKVVYEPVHKSLLEFAAAYKVYVNYKERVDLSIAEKESVISITRSHDIDITSPLLVDFLVGLMGKYAGAVFNGLLPYKQCITNHFMEYFQKCLLETKLTNAVLESLSPFLPKKWDAEEVAIDGDFLVSEQYEKIIRWGLHTGSFNYIRCGLERNAHIPNDALISTFILDSDVRSASITDKMDSIRPDLEQIRHKKCNILHVNLRHEAYYSPYMQRLLDSLELTEFQRFSLSLCDGLLSSFYNYAVSQKSKNIGINCINICHANTDFDLTKMVSGVVERNPMEHLELNIAKFTCKPAIDALLCNVAKYASLNTFILVMDTYEINAMSIDFAKLCNEHRTHWKCVKLEKVKVKCSEAIKEPMVIDRLDLHDSVTTAKTARNIRNCHVKSLACSAPFLSYCRCSWPLVRSLTELSIDVDDSVNNERFSLLSQISNLKILSFWVTRNWSDYSPVENWLLGSSDILSLEGLEIWNVHANPHLSEKLLAGIVKCLERREHHDSGLLKPSLSTGHESEMNSLSKQIELQYLVVNFSIDCLIASRESEEVIKILADLQRYLIERCLPRLDIVLFDLERCYFSTHVPFSGCGKIFSPEKGFQVEYDVLGSRENDSISAKIMHDRYPGMVDRITVTHCSQN